MDSFLLKEKFIRSIFGNHIGGVLGMPIEGESFEAIEKNYREIRDMLDVRL
ncbi:MAG: hypothetical protein SWO11_03560 [Thermodesulfobacteriota bacterium]|nr:hypothetical protein [Thermodesulfobacteriota bacterium]